MVILNGNQLSLEDVQRVLFENAPVKVDDEAWARVERSRKMVEDIVEEEKVVYGINTGFGKFSDVLIHKDDVKQLQVNLIRSHACGVGQPFPEVVSRAMLLLRANALLKGFSGVRRCIIERLIWLLNEQIHPIVPSQGSLGASGDLAPLSHMALALIGEGEVYVHGEKISTSSLYEKRNTSPLELSAKEGLALINGTQAMTAVGVVNYLEAERLALQAEKVAALTLEGLRGVREAFDPDLHHARGYPEQCAVAERITNYITGSKLITSQGDIRVQDAYSLRCIPQVHGAIWQTLGYVKDKLQIEINAATDNPLLFPEQNKVISGGHFHGQPIAFAMDFLGIAMSELANISERRIERLVNPQLNDLPPFLSPQPGLQSGAMILQYSAASLVSENKTLAHPASVDSIPSSANQEDHVSMGTTAARHAYEIIQNSRRVLSIEFICALQAVEYRGTERLAPYTKQLFNQGRRIVPSITEDRIFSGDIEAVGAWLASGDSISFSKRSNHAQE